MIVNYVDIDGQLCTNTWGEYDKAVPIMENIAKVNKLYDSGETVVLWTARGTGTGIDWKDVTLNQMKKWGVRFHELCMGKPVYNRFFDDRCFNLDTFDGMEYKNKDHWSGQVYTLETSSPVAVKKYGRVVSLIPADHTGGRVLDVGCGNGCLHNILLDNGFSDVYGFDFTSNFIDNARNIFPDFNYLVHDANKPFPYENDFFDVVLCAEVLEHISSPYLVLENIFRVLKPGGVMIVSTPNGLHREFNNLFYGNFRVKPNVFQYMTPGVLMGMIREIGGRITFHSPFWRHIYIRAVKDGDNVG